MPSTSARSLVARAALVVASLSLANCAVPSSEPEEGLAAAPADAALPRRHETRPVCPRVAGKRRCRSHVIVRSDDEVFTSTNSGYTPHDLGLAYSVPAGGDGVTIAILGGGDYADTESDLAVYRSTFGLPACTTANGCFSKVNGNGQTSPLPSSQTGDPLETALDLAMASAACPACNLLLVESSDSGTDEEFFGIPMDTAVALGATVISTSWGDNGDPSDAVSVDAQHFVHPGVSMLAASGDGGYDLELGFPGTSPHILAVGGTTLSRDPGARGFSETVWNAWTAEEAATTSGCSTAFAKPAWQTDTLCTNRTVADVAAVADTDTGGVAVYCTSYGGWIQVGGTSAASPFHAGFLAASGNAGVAPSYPYENPGLFHDLTTGSNIGGSSCNTALCHARPGFDGPTGIGTPGAGGAQSAVASNVTVSGVASVGATIKAKYDFSDSLGLSKTGVAYQWFQNPSGAMIAIEGATSHDYVPALTDLGQAISVCVFPFDANGRGAMACSPTVIIVPGVVWYTGESQTGTAIPDGATNGACVTLDQANLTPGEAVSLALYSQSSTGDTTITMYPTPGCESSVYFPVYQRTAGPGTVRDINLGVSIGIALASYAITW